MLLAAPLGTLDAGALPAASFGVGGALGIRSSGWRVVLGARILRSQTWLIPEGVGADVARWRAELSLCRGWNFGRLELGPCLSTGLDALHARGTGPDVTARSQRSLSVVLGAAAVAHLHVLESMAIFGSAGFGFQTSRARLVIDGTGEIGQVGSTDFSLALGPEWIF
jgi:hypothetical protein